MLTGSYFNETPVPLMIPSGCNIANTGFGWNVAWKPNSKG